MLVHACTGTLLDAPILDMVLCVGIIGPLILTTVLIFFFFHLCMIKSLRLIALVAFGASGDLSPFGIRSLKWISCLSI